MRRTPSCRRPACRTAAAKTVLSDRGRGRRDRDHPSDILSSEIFLSEIAHPKISIQIKKCLKQCVPNSFQCSCEDILIPIVDDQRLPTDCLYFILEEDFRFWPPGKDPDGADDYDEAYCKLRMDRLTSPPPSRDPPASSRDHPPTRRSAQSGSSNDDPAAAAASGTKFHEVLPRGTITAKHASADDMNCGFSQDVADMVRMATMCHREGCGDLIWASWVPVKRKTTRIGHGSAMILMTRNGFRSISWGHHWGQLKRGHIDLMLQDWLRLDGVAERAKACYLYPPIGSYTEHASECDPKNFGGDKTRASGFDSGENPCHGTRVASDPKQRAKYIYKWRGNDWGKRECTPFPSDELLHTGKKYWWLTAVKPTSLADAKDEKGKGKKKGCNPGNTQRQKRLVRMWRQAQERREWVDDSDEARSVCIM